MSRMRFLTAGESHGPRLTAIVEGCPAGVAVSAAVIDADLARRQGGYGRGARQAIERDRVEITAGVRYGRTTGAPVALSVLNDDAANWGDVLAVAAPTDPAGRAAPVRVPRPGHADLGGALLYDHEDIRDVIERSSARETAARVAAGGIAKALLAELECRVASHVVAIGDVRTDAATAAPGAGSTAGAGAERGRGAGPGAALLRDGVLDQAAVDRVEADPVRCADPDAGARMRAAIDAAAAAGDTLGGVIELVIAGCPAGVGSYVQGDRRLGALLAAAALAVPAMKGVEIGLGFAAAGLPGGRVHDALGWDEARGYVRAGGNAGGIEGGISTGAPLVLRVAMKPIATLRTPLPSVELGTHRAVDSRFERSDVCAVPAAGVALEAAVALALADAVLERFGGATAEDLRGAVAAFQERCRRR